MHGNENWKWGAVFILLAIFLVTANQAYKTISSQEDFDPPDDWQKGDSWDIENNPNNLNSNLTIPKDIDKLGIKETASDSQLIEVTVDPNANDGIDWDNL